jgi:hypothetical protein
MTGNDANDEPPVRRAAGDDPRRRRFASLQDGVAKRGDRPRSCRRAGHLASPAAGGPARQGSYSFRQKYVLARKFLKDRSVLRKVGCQDIDRVPGYPLGQINGPVVTAV